MYFEKKKYYTGDKYYIHLRGKKVPKNKSKMICDFSMSSGFPFRLFTDPNIETPDQVCLLK